MGTSDTVDDLSFSIDKPISISASPTTLPENGDNLISTSVAKVKLKANSTNSNASFSYYVYFQIITNTFVYSDTKTPEMLLSIIDPNNNEITTLDELQYKTVNGVSGFDITSFTGFIKIAEEYPITSTSSSDYTTHSWTFKVTYLNLPIDQSINFGNNITTKIYLQKSSIKDQTIAEVQSTNTLNSISLLIPPSDKTSNIEKYYFSIDNGKTYQESSTNTYTFSNLEAKKIYPIKIYGIDTYNRKTKILTTQKSTYPFYEYIKDTYTGKDTLLYHNSSLTNGANDNSYRYSGGDYILTTLAKNKGYTSVTNSIATGVNALVHYYENGSRQYVGYNSAKDITNYYYTLDYNEDIHYNTYKEALEAGVTDGYLTKDNIKNFVCFGSNETPCPIENLYRIIGVFNDSVKLIKYKYATKEQLNTKSLYGGVGEFYFSAYDSNNVDMFYWNSEESNNWETSTLNTDVLNKTYLNSLGDYWSNKIGISSWQIGGNTYTNLAKVVKEVYQNEIVNPVENKTITAKVGLMYISDYGYAAINSQWTRALDNYGSRNVKSDNWLYNNVNQWTITKVTDQENRAMRLYASVLHHPVKSMQAIKPTFYLKNTINYASGTGTEQNPYYID